MSSADFGTGKSLLVLAIVVGCFAILWPKIFYPMLQSAFALSSPSVGGDPSFHGSDPPAHMRPGFIKEHRNALPKDVEDKFHLRDGKPFPHPQTRNFVKNNPKSGGAMSIIMPIYTVGIIVFFLYTILKLVLKKPAEAENKPLIKDFHMNAQHGKFMCGQKLDADESTYSRKSESLDSDQKSQDFDPKDEEILKLKKKLQETEEAVTKIMEHMGAMSACLTAKTDLHRKNSKQSGRTKARASPKKQQSTKRYRQNATSKSCQAETGSRNVFPETFEVKNDAVSSSSGEDCFDEAKSDHSFKGRAYDSFTESELSDHSDFPPSM